MLSVVDGKPFPNGTELSLVIDEYPKGLPRGRRNIFTYKTPVFEEKIKDCLQMQKYFKQMFPIVLRIGDWVLT